MSMELIIKAPVFKRLGDQSRVAGFHSSPLLANIISDLKTTTKSLTDIALSAGMYSDTKQAEHFDKDWLNSTNAGFWSTGQYDVPGLIRAGVIKALEVYKTVSRWISSGCCRVQQAIPEGRSRGSG
jgi:hypothetical protein